MHRFFIRHKLDENDITHLSDSDSIFVIEKLHLAVEDFIEVETYDTILLARITNVNGKSVEVEILERIEEKKGKDEIGLTLIQSLIGNNKFRFVIEKSVEIGVDRIIPIQSQYSHIKKNKAVREYELWKEIVKDATEQSRNIKPTIIEKPISIHKLEVEKNSNKLCLATENVDTFSLREYLESIDIKKPIILAIGPEKGWNSRDLEILKEKGFKFIKLEGNILRTETTGLVVSSIIQYLRGKI